MARRSTRLTKVSIKEYAQTSPSHPERCDKAPHFWQWKLEYPWQVEDNTTSTDDVAVHQQRRTKRQCCQSPSAPASERLPLQEKAGPSDLETGGAAQYASIWLQENFGSTKKYKIEYWIHDFRVVAFRRRADQPLSSTVPGFRTSHSALERRRLRTNKT